ncbi:MAG: oxidoreductase [Candidatus Omnitrophica bacterium]|nr:oxidoreductase [Candidatus Omnitrophota bacterium]
MMNMGHMGVCVVVLPLLTALACFLFQDKYTKLCVTLGGVGSILLAFLLGFQIFQHGEYAYALGGWPKPLGIHLNIDGFSVVMLCVTALLGCFLCFYAFGYFPKGKPLTISFWPLCFFCVAGLNVLFLSFDLFNIYVALEIISFSAISLVALSASTTALAAATQYFFLTIIGSLVYLLGVVFIYGAYSTLDFGLLSGLIQPGVVTGLALTLMTIGLIIKSALFPMHFWLPSAHANAPAPVSAILSGLVIMGSFYMLVRLWFETFAGIFIPLAGQLIGVLASIAILGGAVMALRQTRIKMMLAYSTISQIGYMFLIFPLYSDSPLVQGFAWNGGIYLALSHAFAKGSAFMVAGIILYVLGRDNLEDCVGLAERYPLTFFAFGLAGVSLIGLPPSGGFIGKWMLLKAAMLSGQWGYALLIAFGSILSAAYIFRIFEVFLHKPLSAEKSLAAPMGMQLSALVIASIATMLGLAANIPLTILRIGSMFSLDSMKGLIF